MTQLGEKSCGEECKTYHHITARCVVAQGFVCLLQNGKFYCTLPSSFKFHPCFPF